MPSTSETIELETVTPSSDNHMADNIAYQNTSLEHDFLKTDVSVSDVNKTNTSLSSSAAIIEKVSVAIKQKDINDSADVVSDNSTQNMCLKQNIKEEKMNAPIKSSMEILSELFSSFDAEPPVIIKKEKSEHKKHKKEKKKHKHKKKKEKKRKKRDSDYDKESSPTKVIKTETNSPKRIKIEREEVKEKANDTQKQNDRKSKIVIKDLKFSSIFEATIREIREKQEKEGKILEKGNTEEEKMKKHKKKHHKHRRSRDVSSSREKHRSRDRSRSNSRKSDEDYDTWHRSRKKNYDRSRSRDKERNDRSSYYKHCDRDKYRVDKDRNRYSEYKNQEKERNKNHRDRSGSRDSRGDSSSYIDKKKLLEIARRNAIQMMKSGSLPGALTLGPQAQEKVIAAIKAGGKTVEELTEFCKTLSQKEALGELSSASEDNSDSDNEKAFHHPFQIKDRPTSITMNIKVPICFKNEKMIRFIKKFF